MSTSSRFAVAVHILTGLALKEGVPLPSERLAASVNTNATVVRRLLMSLAQAGLTTAQLGVGGGALLARPADQVTLLDVYRAVEAPELVAVHRSCPSESCMVGANILPALRRVTFRAERAFEAELQAVTVAQLAAEVLQAAREREALSPG